MKLSEFKDATFYKDDRLSINAWEFVEFVNQIEKDREELRLIKSQENSLLTRIDDLIKDKNQLYRRNAELINKNQILEAKISFYEMEQKHIILDLKA
jgi:hypothetical protein